MGVLGLDERLVSWGEDGAIRFWSLEGERIDPAWIAPTGSLDFVSRIDGELWVGLQGRPHQLLVK